MIPIHLDGIRTCVPVSYTHLSYPYSCISVFAIHPQYADLHALPELKDAKARAEAEKTRAELNALDKICLLYTSIKLARTLVKNIVKSVRRTYGSVGTIAESVDITLSLSLSLIHI